MMKTMLVTCLCSGALLASVLAQIPPAPPAPPTPAATTSPLAAAVASVSPSATPEDQDESLEARIDRKVKKHLHINVDTGSRSMKHSGGDEDIGALMAIPIVGIIFTTLFGAPVLIVGLIMFFSFWKARSLHRTVRLLVEKGQPIPEALFATPTIRARSDMRRGVVLIMVGLGLMIFLGAINDWEGGVWAIGAIPFLIGAGYLAVWRLEGNKPGVNRISNTSTDMKPPVA